MSIPEVTLRLCRRQSSSGAPCPQKLLSTDELAVPAFNVARRWSLFRKQRQVDAELIPDRLYDACDLSTLPGVEWREGAGLDV
jgi:hypothetical protein